MDTPNKAKEKHGEIRTNITIKDNENENHHVKVLFPLSVESQQQT